MRDLESLRRSLALQEPVALVGVLFAGHRDGWELTARRLSGGQVEIVVAPRRGAFVDVTLRRKRAQDAPLNDAGLTYMTFTPRLPEVQSSRVALFSHDPAFDAQFTIGGDGLVAAAVLDAMCREELTALMCDHQVELGGGQLVYRPGSKARLAQMEDVVSRLLALAPRLVWGEEERFAKLLHNATEDPIGAVRLHCLRCLVTLRQDTDAPDPAAGAKEEGGEGGAVLERKEAASQEVLEREEASQAALEREEALQAALEEACDAQYTPLALYAAISLGEDKLEVIEHAVEQEELSLSWYSQALEHLYAARTLAHFREWFFAQFQRQERAIQEAQLTAMASWSDDALVPLFAQQEDMLLSLLEAEPEPINFTLLDLLAHVGTGAAISRLQQLLDKTTSMRLQKTIRDTCTALLGEGVDRQGSLSVLDAGSREEGALALSGAAEKIGELSLLTKEQEHKRESDTGQEERDES